MENGNYFMVFVIRNDTREEKSGNPESDYGKKHFQ
jgi:hypothetical protein